MDEEKTTGLKGKGSRVLGVLGALLGAFLGTFCWHLLMFFSLGREFAWGSLTILGGIVVSWTACWGYRLLRGYRAMGFAKWTVRICMLLAQPASMAVVFTMMSLRQRYGSLRVHADTLAVVFGQSVQNLLQTDILLLLGQLSLIVLVFSRLGWVTLLKYVDPQWAADPRRIAQTNGGGASFNLLPGWPLPDPGPVPERFTVDKNLEVNGEELTFRRRMKQDVRFRPGDIGGVVLGPSNGFNVIYGRDKQVLAKFAWSRKNALLLGQYLLQRGVTFVDPSGAPVSVGGGAVRPDVPRQFTVREGKVCLVLGWMGVILFGGMLSASFFFLEGLELLICAAAFLVFTAGFGWVLLSYYRRRLEVEGENLTYTTAFGRVSQFHSSQVEKINYRGLLGTQELRDREGQVLARFESNMKNAALLQTYINQRLEARRPAATERKD